MAFEHNESFPPLSAEPITLALKALHIYLASHWLTAWHYQHVHDFEHQMHGIETSNVKAVFICCKRGIY